MQHTGADRPKLSKIKTERHRYREKDILLAKSTNKTYRKGGICTLWSEEELMEEEERVGEGAKEESSANLAEVMRMAPAADADLCGSVALIQLQVGVHFQSQHRHFLWKLCT
jgi:hypothetical protein